MVREATAAWGARAAKVALPAWAAWAAWAAWVEKAATVVADAYADREWSARVSTISPATGAEFALLPPQNASGNWVKVVQRVPVRITLEPNAENPPLRAGMTVTVRVDTGRSRSLAELGLR